MPGRPRLPPASIWIVVAAFNERPAIARVAGDLLACWPNVVVVDDGSTDGTGEAAVRAGATVVRHAVNRGQGAALATGVQYALRRGAAAIVTFDADGQHRAADVERLVAALAAHDADVALGSRFLGGPAARRTMPPARAWLLRAAVLWTRLQTGLAITDTHNGLRAFTRRAAGLIRWRADRMAHASEILDEIRHHDLRFVEVPVEIDYTGYSLAKGQHGLQAFRVVIEYLVDLVTR